MEKTFYDFCYEALSQHLEYKDVADTVKDIWDGLKYRQHFPWPPQNFDMEKPEIIEYIKKVRLGNIIDQYKEHNALSFIPSSSGRSLWDLSPQELFNDLSAEIPRLIVKGTHQLIKHLSHIEDDNALTAELVQNDVTVLEKYGLSATEEMNNGQA